MSNKVYPSVTKNIEDIKIYRGGSVLYKDIEHLLKGVRGKAKLLEKVSKGGKIKFKDIVSTIGKVAPMIAPLIALGIKDKKMSAGSFKKFLHTVGDIAKVAGPLLPLLAAGDGGTIIAPGAGPKIDKLKRLAKKAGPELAKEAVKMAPEAMKIIGKEGLSKEAAKEIGKKVGKRAVERAVTGKGPKLEKAKKIAKSVGKAAALAAPVVAPLLVTKGMEMLGETDKGKEYYEKLGRKGAKYVAKKIKEDQTPRILNPKRYRTGGGRKPSAWNLHVKEVKSKNPGKPLKEILKLASASYHKGKGGTVVQPGAMGVVVPPGKDDNGGVVVPPGIDNDDGEGGKVNMKKIAKTIGSVVKDAAPVAKTVIDIGRALSGKGLDHDPCNHGGETVVEPQGTKGNSDDAAGFPSHKQATDKKLCCSKFAHITIEPQGSAKTVLSKYTDKNLDEANRLDDLNLLKGLGDHLYWNNQKYDEMNVTNLPPVAILGQASNYPGLFPEAKQPQGQPSTSGTGTKRKRGRKPKKSIGAYELRVGQPFLSK